LFEQMQMSQLRINLNSTKPKSYVSFYTKRFFMQGTSQKAIQAANSKNNTSLWLLILLGIQN